MYSNHGMNYKIDINTQNSHLCCLIIPFKALNLSLSVVVSATIRSVFLCLSITIFMQVS